MLTRKILHNGKLCMSASIYIPRRNLQNAEGVQVFEHKSSLPEREKKLQQRPPFLKNIFTGRFDTEFLTFPHSQSKERYTKFREFLKPIENYVTSINSKEVDEASRRDLFIKLKEFDVLRARIDQNYDGLNMLEIETVKLLDTLGSVPWLTTCLNKNNIIPVEIISKYGNDAQKANYLPKIGNGDLLPTVCITEVTSGPNVQNIEATAQLSNCGNFWILNGKKVFVVNGEDSNLFLVIAHCTDEYKTFQNELLSTFIVESSHEGITCSDVISTVGQQQVQVCTVEFKNTCIPKENLLGKVGDGNTILVDMFSPGNSRNAGEAIGLLRSFLSSLNKNIIGRKHLDKNMHEFEAVEEIVTQMTVSLYCMESVAYFTSAIDDLYENQDLELEKAVIGTYCANECVQQIYKGLQVIGVESYLKDNPHMCYYLDALGLSIFDGSIIDEKTYIALLGLQYTGTSFREHVYKARNYLSYPVFFFKEILLRRRPKQLHLHEYLHPSFKLAAEVLEYGINVLKANSLFLLETHGTEISSKQVLLQKLADIAIEVYVVVAVLTRASRSYCIGIRNADVERCIALYVAQKMRDKIEMFNNTMEWCYYGNEKILIETISEAAFQKKGYMCEDPLQRLF